MKIIEKNYKWKGSLSTRNKTDYLILHHAACEKASADDIHRIHLANGWTGIGYHFYVRKDGRIYRGRPIGALGAHTSGRNSCSIGVCFEGNFENEIMSDAQLKSGWDLVVYIKKLYPNISIKKHRDFNSTACPGMNFPFEKITEKKRSEITDSEEIVNSLVQRGIITDASLWRKKCSSDANAYWLAVKICNMTVNKPVGVDSIKDAASIVNELSARGIILDKALWNKLLKDDTALYWLGFKAANMTGNGVA